MLYMILEDVLTHSAPLFNKRKERPMLLLLALLVAPSPNIAAFQIQFQTSSFQSNLCALSVERSSMETKSSIQSLAQTRDLQLSLASSFLIEISQDIDTEFWALTPVRETDVSSEGPDLGAQAWTALQTSSQQGNRPSSCLLKCQKDGDTLTVAVSLSDIDLKQPDSDLVFVLSRILLQHKVSTLKKEQNNTNTPEWKAVFSNENGKELTFTSYALSADNIHTLFETKKDIEMVDMVDREGKVLGVVPRNLVHSFNLLHRGIGLTVSKDAEFSELYVHRRTDSKRIFPGLYDMFVGGISLAGEDPQLTAAREVAEELGLSCALQSNSTALSDPLFTCIVCTSYNRCIVTVFRYTMKPSQETVSWQDEEVAWGAFIPYNIVKAAADLSIQRLVERKCWPGTYPVLQSNYQRNIPPVEYENDGTQNWDQWDFVPDGLLVWEAWLRWQGKRRANK